MTEETTNKNNPAVSGYREQYRLEIARALIANYGKDAVDQPEALVEALNKISEAVFENNA